MSSVEEARDEDIAGALVGGAIGGDEVEKMAVGFVKASVVAEGVDDAADVEGVEFVSAAAELMQKADGGVGVSVDGA